MRPGRLRDGDVGIPLCIPIWYRTGMTVQIAVRLPEDLVEFVDEMVGRGAANSRAALITRLLERERRRQQALRDLEIITATDDPDMDALIAWQAEHIGPVD